MPTDDPWSQRPPRGDSHARHDGPPARYGRNDGYDHNWPNSRQPDNPPGPRAPRLPPEARRPPEPRPPQEQLYAGPRAPRQPGIHELPPPDAAPLDAPLGTRSRPIRSHGRRKRRVPLGALLIVVLGLLAVGAGLRYVPGSPFAAAGAVNAQPSVSPPTLEPTPTPEPLPFQSAPVSVSTINSKGFVSWALLDRRSGEIVGSANMDDATTTTASMIKAWLAADYLRRATEKGEEPTTSRLRDLEALIRDSNNEAADRTYAANNRTSSIQRLIDVCGLTDAKATSGSWSKTFISAQDAVRYGSCIADGRAAGAKWTPWVLDMMRSVRGDGDFGIREALPTDLQSQVAIKNGWLRRDDVPDAPVWHTSCLAIGDTWVMAVLQRYPPTGNWTAEFNHTTQVCTTVAQQLLNPDA